MDINDLRSAFTVVVCVAFVGIVWWAFSAKRKASFDDAARLPLEEDDAPVGGCGIAGHRDN